MNIAYIGDQKGKVHWNRFLVFKKYITDHNFTFLEVNENIEKACRKFDAVYYASLGSYINKPVEHKYVMASATSWKCITHVQENSLRNALEKLFKISANNAALCKQLKKLNNNVQMICNGVEGDFFVPKEKSFKKPFVIGWVGNKDRQEKNYESVLLPLLKFDRIKKENFQFNILATSKSEKVEKLLTKEQMRDYYQSLDFYLVTSSYEGTPNPALEAAACGKPIITTRVGNMPELIKEAVNGYLVMPHHSSIISALNEILKITEEQYKDMSRLIRKDIETDWTWEKACKLFDNFFRV